jgi:hypothetical protein
MALEKGVINSDQLLQALAAQERLREDGKPVPLLGQILVELGYLTPEKLQELIEFIYPVGDDVHGNDEHGNDKHGNDKHGNDKHSAGEHSADKHSADKHSAGEHSDEKMAGSEEA